MTPVCLDNIHSLTSNLNAISTFIKPKNRRIHTTIQWLAVSNKTKLKFPGRDQLLNISKFPEYIIVLAEQYMS